MTPNKVVGKKGTRNFREKFRGRNGENRRSRNFQAFLIKKEKKKKEKKKKERRNECTQPGIGDLCESRNESWWFGNRWMGNWQIRTPISGWNFVASVSSWSSSSLRKKNHYLQPSPKGRPGMSDVSPLSWISGLSFDSTLLSPLLFFCLVLLLFPYYFFFCLLVHSLELFPENSSIFSVNW